MNRAEIARRYADGFTTSEISIECGLSISTVRRIVKVNGNLRSVKEACQLAGKKGRMGRKRGVKVSISEEAKANIRAAAQNRPAKGYSIKADGYAEFTSGPNKHRSVHRVVAERIIGRKLKVDEVVHHLDHNRSNNDPSNLVVMTASEHSSLHARERINSVNRNERGQYQ